MHELIFLQDLAIVMVVSALVTVVFHRFRQPVVLGYILAGLIVGPHTPPAPLIHDQQSIRTMAEMGVMFLMFSLGLEFSLRKLAKVGATALAGAGFELVVMLLAGYGLGRLFGWGAMDSIFLGAILSMSSTTIIGKALLDLKLNRERFAGLVFGILIVEDIVAIALLALLSGIATTGSLEVGQVLGTLGKLGVFLTTLLVAGLLIVPRLLRYVARFKSDEMLLIAALGLCFGVSMVTAKLGYSLALGAFLIGAIVAEAREGAKIEHLVAPVRDMFSAVFFVAIGMLIDPKLLGEHIVPIVVLTAVVIGGKLLTCGVGSLAAGNDLKTSLRVGMAVSQIGEFSFIIAQLGVTLGVTSEFLYPITVAVSAITTLTTPYLIRSSDPLARGFERTAPRRLVDLLQVYSTWLNRPADQRGGAPAVRKLLRKWAVQLTINLTIAAGLMIAAASIGGRADEWLPRMPQWTGGGRTVVWFAAVLVSLPLVVASVRKLRAASMLVAELMVPASAGREQTAAIRSVISGTILGVGCAAMLVLLVLLSSTLLPPWPVLIVLGVGIAGIAAWASKVLIRVYAKAQIALHETLTTPLPSPESAATNPITTILRDAVLEAVTLSPSSPGCGKLIRELGLRTRTGASIVGIEREGQSLVNPGPDEELRPGDRVLLLGATEQLQNARGELEG